VSSAHGGILAWPHQRLWVATATRQDFDLARLRRFGIAHTVAVAVIASVVGLFVHGETAFLVAWTYTGGAVALPALLVNWMIASREIGAMPGGRAWSAGLVWLYVDGLGLLYIIGTPDAPLRSFTVAAVVPPVACFAAAVVPLAAYQRGRRPRRRHVLRTATVVALAVSGATALLLGGRLASSPAAWLARPSAVVAVLATTGAVVTAVHQRRVARSAGPMAGLGLALLAVGAVNAWAMVAQALNDFSLPASPLLAVQAVSMGLLLQVPIHAPRLVGVGGPGADRGRAGRSGRPAGGVVSRAWFAEDPSEDGVLPTRLRRPAIAYVAVTAPLIGAAGLLVEGRSAFLMAWVYTSAVYTTPAMVITWAASRRTRYQAVAWRLWVLAVVALYLNGAGLLIPTLLPDSGVERLAIVAVLPCVALFGTAAIVLMRARSGSRSLAVDVVETTMVGTVIALAVLLFAGTDLWRGDEAWFTVPTALVTVAVTTGLAWMLMAYARMPHHHRELEALGLVLALVGTVDAWAMLAQGLRGFTLPSAPLLLLQALTMGLLLLLPLYVPRTAPRGLERLPPHEQVRNSWALVTLTLAALPGLFVQARLTGDDRPWAPEAFALVLMWLLFLAMARQAMAINETRNLYRQVLQAADERRRLLADVMRGVDDDRHRFASQLHEQAIATYAAFSSLSSEAERAGPRNGSTLLTEASSRLRAAFGDQARSLHRLMLAMQPLEAERGRSPADRLDSPIRAYVDSLYGDAAAPALRVDVREGLTLGWTTEAVVLRVVQEAVGNVRRHAGARRIDVKLDVDGDANLVLTVTDDGGGFDPTAVVHERGIAAMRSFAALIEAGLTVDSRPGAGTTVRLHVRRDGPGDDPAPPTRPHLRLVPRDA
jgi:signal transduction histidine kinase